MEDSAAAPPMDVDTVIEPTRNLIPPTPEKIQTSFPPSSSLVPPIPHLSLHM